jgi:hypothetical protein
VVFENWGAVGEIEVDASDIRLHSLLGEESLGILTIDRGFRNSLSVRLGGRVRLWPRHLWLQLGVGYETAAVGRERTTPAAFDPHKVAFAGGLTARWGRFDLTASYLHLYLPRTTIDDSGVEMVNALNAEMTHVVGNGDYWGHYKVISVTLAVRLTGPWKLED